MISKQVQKKGLLSKLLEKGVKILLKKECKKIGKLKIDIIATSIQIIKGIIEKIYINAEGVNYKELLIDKINIESDTIKIAYNLNKNELRFKNNILIKFRILLSESSIKRILFSCDWQWIKDMICKELFDQDNLEDIKIRNDMILMKLIKGNKAINELEKLEINAEGGKIYVRNERYNNSILIPIEDKVYIKNLYIQNNSIIITATSSVNF